ALFNPYCRHGQTCCTQPQFLAYKNHSSKLYSCIPNSLLLPCYLPHVSTCSHSLAPILPFNPVKKPSVATAAPSPVPSSSSSLPEASTQPESSTQPDASIQPDASTQH
ncbi:unnamed protein product, partial [Staurois parvus]